MRGLQLAHHRLLDTVCHRHLRTANREMNHRLSRQTRHQRPVARLPVVGVASGWAVSRDPLSGVCTSEHGASRVHGSWHGAPDNPSTASAISAILRVIGAARALSAWGRTYGKEKVYGSVP